MSAFAHLKIVTKTQWGILAASLAAAAAWVFSRVANINPAILGDEWVYLVTSRHVGFWDQNPPFNLGNYLFNVVYSSTQLCDAYYLCAKGLNTFFYIGFILSLFVVAMKYLNFWWSLGFAVVVYVSPISMYTSMYLPESIYFLFLGLTLIFLLSAIESDRRNHWIIAGAMLGLAALSKPHALISAIAIGIFILVYSLARPGFFRNFINRAVSIAGGFLVIRLGLGLLLAGPKALAIFSSYGAAESLGTFVSGAGSGQSSSTSGLVGAGPVAGALGLFPVQIVTHTYSLVAYLGVAIAALLVAVISARKSSLKLPQVDFAILVFIWLCVMVISIVLFTGWITGSGDDHTLRVLLRYYDFIFPIVILAGLSVSYVYLEKQKSWVRWASATLVFALLTPAFSGYFGTLVIQIADAPNLAGLVVDRFTFEWTGILAAISLALLAFFPNFFKYGMAGTLAFTLLLTGFQAQGQYIMFRGEDESIDLAGKSLSRILTKDQLENTLMISNSNFDGRAASFWLDANLPIEIVPPGAEVSPSSQDFEYLIVVGNAQVSEGFKLVEQQDSFRLYQAG